MEKGNYLTLRDVGDLVFRVTQRFLFRRNEDSCIDITIQSSGIQENMILCMPDDTRLLLKIFPHKNFSQTIVYRMEVYKTREGDMRGNKVAFLEASRQDSAVEEIQRFVESFLSQLGL